MALSPQQLKQMLTSDEVVLADKLERRIDLALSGQDPDREIFTFSHGDVIPPRVQQEITRRYLAVGWKKVTFTSDQRDGNWIEFER